jgi:hypothetical protein
VWCGEVEEKLTIAQISICPIIVIVLLAAHGIAWTFGSARLAFRESLLAGFAFVIIAESGARVECDVIVSGRECYNEGEEYSEDY